MQTAEFDHNDFNTGQQSKADESLLVKFYIKSVKDNDASSQEGRPIFKEREYIEITIPGSRDLVTRPARVEDKERFPRHYEAFQQRIEMPVEGTPLVEWPAINRSFADELAFLNIKTVEQLADLNDNSMNFMGAQNWKAKAKDWLEATKDDGVLSQLRDELELRDVTISTQADQIADLVSRLDELEAAPKKGK